MFRSVAFGTALVLGFTSLAAAQSADEQALCTDDAFRVCSHTIPDRERTFQCMVANRESLSAGCRGVMAKLLPPEPASQKAAQRARKGQAQGQGQGQGPINLNPTAAR
jgi:hypothetical protein